MHMKICDHCKGDGFWRRAVKDTHPQQNVFRATAIYADGARLPAQLTRPTYEQPITYEFPCFKCSETGEIQWTRGKSIPPLSS